MKKTLSLTLLAAVLFALVSCASKEAAVEPAVVEEPAISAAKLAAMEEPGFIDLETWQTMDSFAMKFNKDAYTLTFNGGEYFQFPLPTEMVADSQITVHITGTNNGKAGFRSWVVDQNQTTLSDPLYLGFKPDGADYVEGDFDITYTLNATAPAMYLFIKGPQWGTMIDNLVIKSVAVTYE
ncbi:MAG: hypothetical protein MJ188_09805 [Treponema sp.]|nr:hypothetical protein [Treponema sp.]